MWHFDQKLLGFFLKVVRGIRPIFIQTALPRNRKRLRLPAHLCTRKSCVTSFPTRNCKSFVRCSRANSAVCLGGGRLTPSSPPRQTTKRVSFETMQFICSPTPKT